MAEQHRVVFHERWGWPKTSPFHSAVLVTGDMMIRNLVSILMLNGNPFQAMWEKVYRLAITGMNIGPADEVTSSGEQWTFHRFLSKQSSRPRVFDVGANRGQWATMALSETQDIDLHCFEPSTSAFRDLQRTLSASSSVQLSNFGFSDMAGVAPLYFDMPGSGLGSVFSRKLDHLNISMTNQEEVHLTTIDQFCKEQRIDHIHFLKLDVEGAELRVLAGAKEMLSSDNIDFIQFEFGGCNIDSRTYFRDFWYLLTPRYAIYRLVRNGLFRISSYTEAQERFITTNYVAIHSKADALQ